MAKITYKDKTSEIVENITWNFLKNLNERYYEIVGNDFIRIVEPNCFNELLSYNDFNIATIPYPYEEEREDIIIIEMTREEYSSL